MGGGRLLYRQLAEQLVGAGVLIENEKDIFIDQ